MNQLLLITVLFTVAACATPGPEPGRFESDPGPEPAQVSAPAQATGTVQAEEPRGDDMVASNDADAAEGFTGIEELEAPSVSKTPRVPESGPPLPAIVCKKVVPTGSILPVKVCNHRSDIERKQMADQKMFDIIKRNTANGASRL